MLTLPILPVLAFVLGQEPQEIFLNAPLVGGIHLEDPAGESPTLHSHPNYAGEPTHSERFSFTCPSDGVYSISLRSFDFDSYLILRSENGTILKEDDDGLIPYPQHSLPLHSFVEFQALKSETYLLDAVALHGDVGQFELLVELGPRGQQPIEALAELSAQDAHAWVNSKKEGEHDLFYARILLEAGRRMMSLSLPMDALPFFEEAVPLWEEMGHPLDIWTAQFDLSFCYLTLGLPKKCELALTKCIGNIDAYSPLDSDEQFEKDIALFELETYLGDSLIRQSRYQESLTILTQAKERADALPPSRTSFLLLDRLASAHQFMGKPNLAIPLFESALRGCLDFYDEKESLDSAHIRNNLGRLYEDLGWYTRARIEQEKALELQAAFLPPLSLDIADSHSNLGLLFALTQDEALAEKHLSEALRIRKELLPNGHRRLAQAHYNLGSLYAGKKKYRKAMRELKKALAMAESSLGTTHKDFLFWSREYAWVLMEMGKSNEAHESLSSTYLVCKDTLGEDHIDSLKTAINLAMARHLVGDSAGALSLATDTRSRIQLKYGPAHTDLMEIDMLRMRIEMEKGNPSSAWGIAQKAYWNAVQQFREQLYSSSTGIQYAYLVHHRRLLNRALSILPHYSVHSAEEEALEMVLHWKGRVGRNLQWAQAQLWENGIEPQKVLNEITRSRSHLSSSILMMPDSITREDVELVGTLREQVQGLERNLWTLVGKPTFPARTPVKELLASMPEESAALLFFAWNPTLYPNNPSSYSTSEARVYAWTIRPGEELERFDLGLAKELRNQIFEYLNSTRGASGFSVDSGPSPGETVYQTLWEPFLNHLEEADPVFISPDVFVAEFPLEIIPEAERYLAEDWSFVYMDDLTQLLRIPEEPSSLPGNLLAVGGVDYGLPEELKKEDPGEENRARAQPAAFWVALENTGQEANEITQLHQEKGLGELIHLTGEEPTALRLLNALPEQGYIHLATHGFFEPEWLPSQEDRLEFKENGEELLEARRNAVKLMPGYLSGLVMTGANLSAPLSSLDAYLSAEEMALSDLSSCRLAVLSACETSLGTEKQGEGLMSLRRSFHLAGAETVVASLWKVKDESTRELMTSFYHGMWEGGLSRSDALTRARRKLIKNLRRRGIDSPKSWGAFILSGDWR
ncbi:MAG: CHAT domain-containing protein [Planctomycetota bacterium]|jgi:CHAT domain-containing protein/tetratricopeptide (TPR) repeat protein|nr:CHAT domain-containing protein [Planctomycetota bacterium]MDP6941494.1 CHAT domain-containing protein [Planctomycetota bacterium]